LKVEGQGEQRYEIIYRKEKHGQLKEVEVLLLVMCKGSIVPFPLSEHSMYV
jgi:hypothetical protein